MQKYDCDDNTFGDLLKNWRKRECFTQEDLSEELGWSGNSFINRLENGVNNPPNFRTLKILGRLLNLNSHDLTEFYRQSFLDRLDADQREHLDAVKDTFKETIKNDGLSPQFQKICDLLADVSPKKYDVIIAMIENLLK
jgi:transcriptional regulator with XRE-family HTH domain|tara:strand:+ start:125 stop:541 length:417 start_codon:yes stop_codon:yes gene_type:complete